jgi:regulator of nucleoside diphosphate kinase
MTSVGGLIMSSRDVRRLEALLGSGRAKGLAVAERLEEEIARAEICEPQDLPPDVVTMNSEVVCIDEASGAQRRLRLVYPEAAGSAADAVSVLAPVGAALLGLRCGQSIDWPLPGGRTARLRVSEVPYQPEAAGLAE